VGCACGTCGGYEKCMQGFGGKLVGNKTIGRSKLRWDGITKMGPTEI